MTAGQTGSHEDGGAAPPEDESLAPEDAWLKSLDIDAFRSDLQELGKRLEKQQGQADLDHLRKIEMWSNISCAIGMASMWMQPNIITVFALSLWTFSRWTMIGHHTCHGGYDKVDKMGKHNRFVFALGSTLKRVSDWFDWMLPEAWNVEHNNLHHYKLGEDKDPDLLERNLDALRALEIPIWAKYVATFLIMCTWKWFYYAPNTYKELVLSNMRRAGKPLPPKEETDEPLFVSSIFRGNHPVWCSVSQMWMDVMGPYLLLHFVVLPLPLFFVSKDLFWNAVTNLVLAEILTNVHAFIVIATNHCGDDLYRFADGCKYNSGVFFLRQVISSVNFHCGNDVVDFMHGWLNYQIEHHLWPNLSMLSYQRSQPLVQEICKKHNVPYLKHNVFWRLKKTVDIMVGSSSMRVFPPHVNLSDAEC